MLKLVRPSSKYKKSFIAATKEFEREEGKGASRGSGTENASRNFNVFTDKMRDYEKGRNLPKGHVPSSYYWLVENSEVVGEATIRHKLTATLLKKGGHVGYGIKPSKRKMGYGVKILELCLKKARQKGLKKVLITCDDDNVGSWKIIEANGGVLKNKIKYQGKLIRRYWVVIQ